MATIRAARSLSGCRRQATPRRIHSPPPSPHLHHNYPHLRPRTHFPSHTFYTFNSHPLQLSFPAFVSIFIPVVTTRRDYDNSAYERVKRLRNPFVIFDVYLCISLQIRYCYCRFRYFYFCYTASACYLTKMLKLHLKYFLHPCRPLHFPFQISQPIIALMIVIPLSYL